MNRTNYDWGVKQTDNWCCNTECDTQGAEVIGFRKNIILKSAQKNEKSLKTSLKKRAGSNDTCRETKKQDNNHQQHPKIYPVKQFIQVRNIKPVQSSMMVQRIQLASAAIPTANYIKFTPEKSNHHQPKKINFIYNNKINMPVDRMGVNDLQTLNNNIKIIQPVKIQHKPIKVPYNITYNTRQNPHNVSYSTNYNTPYNTGYNTAIQSRHNQPQLGKSTLNTYFNSERGQSHGDNLGRSKNLKMQPFSPGFQSERGQQRQPINSLISLTSRKQTVLSVNGDSQSQTSIAIHDFQDPILLKFNSIQTSKDIDSRSKFSPGGLGYSLNL